MSKLSKQFRLKLNMGSKPVNPIEVTDTFFIQEDEDNKLKKLEDIWDSDCWWCSLNDPFQEKSCSGCHVADIINKLWNKPTF